MLVRSCHLLSLKAIMKERERLQKLGSKRTSEDAEVLGELEEQVATSH